MPFPVKAVQIDGGSEFKAEFEEACAAASLPLFVLLWRLTLEAMKHMRRINGADAKVLPHDRAIVCGGACYSNALTSSSLIRR